MCTRRSFRAGSTSGSNKWGIRGKGVVLVGMKIQATCYKLHGGGTGGLVVVLVIEVVGVRSQIGLALVAVLVPRSEGKVK